jgi:hypothetical protein
LRSCEKGEGILTAGCGAADDENGWAMRVLVGDGSEQFTAQHKRACDVAAESLCARAALQQSIMFMSMPVCIWAPAVTLPLSAMTRTRDVNHFNIARADCTYRLETLSSIEPNLPSALSQQPPVGSYDQLAIRL